MARDPARDRGRRALALCGALAVGAGVALWMLGRAPERPRVEVLHRAPGMPAAQPPPAAPALPMPPPDALPPEAQAFPEAFRDRAQAEAEEVIPPRVAPPRLEKLVRDRLSEVPHHVLGAWDEAPESDQPGARRAFVLVVDPRVGDAELEALARDVRERHRDSALLDVRIYDDEAATVRPRGLDGGRAAFEHLVAEVKRHEAAGLDVIRVRGRRIDP